MSISVSSRAVNDSVRQKLRSTTESLLKQYFGSTLNTVDDMVNIFMALMLKESSFNVNAEFSTPLSPITSSGAFDYQNSSAIQRILRVGSDKYSPEKAANEPQGRTAMGLTQVMGWNIVRGASKSGSCLVEQSRPDLSSVLCVNPGDSIRAKLTGEANISNSILAGLVVLESKYKNMKLKNNQWSINVGGRDLVFPSRIYGAVAGYLGYATKGDANGTNYLTYASQIVGGSFYASANGSAAPSVSSSKPQSAALASAGPITTGGAGKVPGCIATS